jgi:paraquat-inducible protein B
MAREASRTLVGAFVVGAVALAVAAITAVAGGKFIRNRPTYVMFFSGSITGLSVGSPVEFRGVRVGEVTKIAAVFDPETLSIAIPVYVELDPGALVVGHDREGLGGARSLNDVLPDGTALYRPLLEKGLKAQLDIRSLVTMQLYVSLDFVPDAPAKLVGLESRYPEIPTVPSLREQMAETLHKLPERLLSAADGIDRLVHSPALDELLRSAGGTLADLDGILRETRGEVKPLLASLRATSDAARRSLAQAERTLALREGPAAELAASMNATMKEAGASLEQLRATLAAYEQLASRNANVGYDLSRTLEQVDVAARAVRSLADDMALHPEAVLKGKR